LEGPPQEEIEREAAWEVEVRIFAMLLARMAVGNARYNGLEEWVGRAMVLGIQRMIREFGVIWLCPTSICNGSVR
jgi:hypothetical protein